MIGLAILVYNIVFLSHSTTNFPSVVVTYIFDQLYVTIIPIYCVLAVVVGFMYKWNMY